MRILLVVLFFLFFKPVFAQNKTILDSLQKIYEESRHDTSKVLALIDIAYEYRNSQPDTTLLLAQKGLAKSQELGFERGKAWAWNRMGIIYLNKGNYALGLEHFEKSLSIFKKKHDYNGLSSTFNNMGNIYLFQGKNLDALEYYQKSLKIREKIKDLRGMASVLGNMGGIYTRQGNYLLALEYYQKSLRIEEKIGDMEGMGYSLGSIAYVYQAEKNYSLAEEYYQKAVRIQEKTNDKRGISINLNNIGIIYKDQKKYNLALDYFQKSLQIKEEIKDKRGISSSLVSIGSIYSEQNKDSLAAVFYQKSIQIKEEIKDKRGLLYSLEGMAQLFKKQKNYAEAIKNAQKGLELAKEINALAEIKMLSHTLYECHKRSNNFDKALQFFEIAKEANDSLFSVEKSKSIANLESSFLLEKKEKELALLAKNNELDRLSAEKKITELEIIKKKAETQQLLALAQHEKDLRKQDSLFNLAQKKQLETENLQIRKRQLEAENKASQLATQKEKKEKNFQQILNTLISSFLVLALVFIYIIWQNRKKIKDAYLNLSTANIEIIQQKEEIEVQSEELQSTNNALNQAYLDIQKKNEDITDSINYALRIQNAIIPKETDLQKYFDSFVFFRPRDIVSGDFYWFAEKGNTKILVVADCTGHGVSGAFMTIIANNILNQIVHDHEIHAPDEILNQMPIFLEKTLSHGEGKIKDGMDISIVSIEQAVFVDTKTTRISYAGAMNPLYYVQNQEFKEIKADKKPIDGQINKHFSYQKHEIDLGFRELENSKTINPKSTIPNPFTLYLLSDGFQDQFGGENDKKFMVKNLKKLLLEISEKPMNEQKKIVEKTFNNWKGKNEQTDDVLLVGIRI